MSSMKELDFFLVDVFSWGKYSGNQLAIFLNAQGMTETEMQNIAREINFSETCFIHGSQTPGKWTVRIFTPNMQIPFAGHPVLGTAHVLIHQGFAEKSVDLDLPAGLIPVSLSIADTGEQVYWMKQSLPSFGKRLNPAQIAQVLGLANQDIDSIFPIEEVTTGLPHIIVPLKTLDSLKRIAVDRAKYYNLIEQLTAKNLLVFCPETYEDCNDISTRMFADYLGIPEDPATGSGNGCLAAYLVKHKYYGESSINLRSEQGYEMGRPSLLFLKATECPAGIDVKVGGMAVTIAQGLWVV